MSDLEKASISFQNRTLHFHIRRSTRRRTVGITVDHQGVRVAAPKRMPLDRVVELVGTKAPWIAQKLAELKSHREPPKRFVNGETYPYLGRRVQLEVNPHPHRNPVALRGNVLEVRSDDPRSALESWYKARAQEVIRRRVELYCEELGWKVPPVLVRNQKKRWGSCNAKGELRFNWRLVMAPLPLLDYVVIHEMAHLKVLNHSPRFWRLVERIMPDYKERHKALNELGPGLYW
ncbi:MAG: M48 family peptidase [Meiothermus sp.]